MNRTLVVLAVSFSLLASVPIVPLLANEDSDSQEAQKAANQINSEAESESGKAAVVNKLKNEFNVEESQINALRAKKLGYGEIGIALSLAEQLPGGITNENIQKVMDLRQADAKSGWGNVAKQLNLNLGKVVSETKKVANEHQSIQNPDINKHTPGEETSQPKFQSPALAGRLSGETMRSIHSQGAGKGRR